MATARVGRDLAWDACVNVRDLGGLPAGRSRIARRRLVRSDTLTRLTSRGRQALQSFGIRTVIDIRNESEILVQPDPFVDGDPIQLYHLPLQSDALRFFLPRCLAATTRYDLNVATLERCSRNLRAIMLAMANAPPGGIVLHCHSGRDRTGLVIALVLDLVGVPPMDILDDYEEISAEARKEYETDLDRLQDRDKARALRSWIATDRASLERTLEYVRNRHGSVRSWLEAIGVGASAQRALCDRLTD